MDNEGGLDTGWQCPAGIVKSSISEAVPVKPIMTTCIHEFLS